MSKLRGSFFTFFMFTVFLSVIIWKNAIGGEIIENGEKKYLPNMVIIKLNDYPVADEMGNVILGRILQDYLGTLTATNTRLIFPEKYREEDAVGIGRIIEVKYLSEIDPAYVSEKLMRFAEIEWAEPRYVYETGFIPNDPSYGTQWNLPKIKSDLAWDINQGDTSVVIGIVDTGIDWDHPDLAANIWHNWDEISNNGVDDDGNGYVDDYIGWDFGGLTGTPDNDPMEDQPDHGTHVAGISSAVTNNSIGVASIGFKTKIMAVKTTQNDQRGPNGPYIIYGYEGIVYAADNGAQVINCSWGGSSYSIFGQETILYAVSNGALVVAAAGNSGAETAHFPSGFDGVLSVASTDANDLKSSFSTFGTTVDVSAPGSGIYSTWQNNTYATLSGTSMASPLAAGLAALITSQFPGYTPLQVGEQLRVNSDVIDLINPAYTNKIGYGRINAYNSLINTNSISARAVGFEFSDELPGGDGDGIFEAGEIISLGVNFINYLNPTSNLSVSLVSKNAYTTVINAVFNAGSVGTLEDFNNFSSKFTFEIDNSLPQNAVLSFLLDFQDGSYSDYQWTMTIGNPTYASHNVNDILMTVTSKGTIGFNDYPDNSQGDGFKYLEEDNALFEGALILGLSSSQISDVARGSNQSLQNTDFTVIQPYILQTPGVIADQEGSAIFTDQSAPNSIGIQSNLHTYAFSDFGNTNYIILRYRLINITTSEITGLYSGLFFDWDFADANNDITEWDETGGLGYVYRNGGNPDFWIASALISSEDYNFWAIQNDGGDGGFSIYDGFTDSEKWQAISSGIGKPQAGTGDVSHVVSGGPFNISAGDTLDVAFVVMAAEDLNSLRSTVANARDRYQNILNGVPVSVSGEEVKPAKFSLEQNYPNPFNPTTKISYELPSDDFVSLKIYDVLGNEVRTLVNRRQTAGTHEIEFDASGLVSGIYLYSLRSGTKSETRKMILLR
ncbi:MAG: hypothetical protein Kow0098_04920 [Ignavibacteriaceae bacterium]